jgi:hypothetical protein
MRQPHWDRRRVAQDDHTTVHADTGAPAAGTRPVGPDATGGPGPSLPLPGPSLPQAPAESYRELVELDGAHSVRWATPTAPPRALQPDRLDLEMLALIAAMRHVLTSQLHRRFNAGRAATTTQRRLKRLSDAGLVERFQFHRRDGGGIPMCYVIAAAGLLALEADDHPVAAVGGASGAARVPGPPAVAAGADRLRQARHDVRVAGWALALAEVLGGSCSALRGPGESVLSPPTRSSADGRVALAPGDLRLPGGRTPHDFLRVDATGQRVEVERFETVRPDAIVEVDATGRPPTATDVIVELDDRLAVGRAAGKLERYDHFLAGWSVHTQRYGRRMDALPVVVFVCRDRARARECARGADSTLCACRAYAGEYPLDWEYPGRERILFVAERDAHEGLLCAYGVPRLPPEVRVSAAHGDPRASEAAAEPREILGGTGHSAE